MKILRYSLLLISLTLLLSGCSFDDLMSSDDSPYEEHEPRDRREPTDPGDDDPDKGKSNLDLYLPIRVDAQWTYDIRVNKSSRQSDYRIDYVGQEEWRCTHAKFSDSLFVFETQFTGEKTIVSAQPQQRFSESTIATVTAKIHHGKLVLVEEHSNTISPFLGDWLFLLDDQFRVCFDGNQFYENSASMTNKNFHYKLDKNVGMLNGNVTALSDYDKTEIFYTLINHH